MSVGAFRSILRAHSAELDDERRLELEARVATWSREYGRLKHDWTRSKLPLDVAAALGIEYGRHERDKGASVSIAAAPRLRLKFGEVLACFEQKKRHVVDKRCKTPLFSLLEDRNGRVVRARDWDDGAKQRAVLNEDEQPTVRAGDVAAAALAEPGLRAFRAWALGYLAMRGKCAHP